MKLSISTLVCPAWSLDQIIAAVSAAKIGGIDFRGLGPELDITRLPEFNADLPATLKKLRDQQLSVPCFNTSISLTTADEARWNGMLDECRRYAVLAEKTQTLHLRVFGGGIGQLKRDEARSLAQRHLRQLVKICKPHNTMPALETHDDWLTAAQVMEVVNAFDPAEVSVLWDIDNVWRQGEPVADTVAGLRRFIKCVHVKDSRKVNGHIVPTLLGQGEIPLADSVAALRQIGYDGWYTLETEKRWIPTAPEPEQSIPQFAEYMRRL